jgi:hypothetical protein
MLNSYVKILLFLQIVKGGLSSANPTRIEILSREGEKFQLATFDLWLPPGVEDIRGIIVHQHGCSRPSEKSGLIGAYDLHWQELAREHDFALLVPGFSMTDDTPSAAPFDLKESKEKEGIKLTWYAHADM